MPKKEDHKSLGFEHVIIIMPHMKSIVEKHIGLPYTLIPPYIAEYFYAGTVAEKKEKQVLIYPKFSQIDYSIVKYLLERHAGESKVGYFSNLVNKKNWKIKEVTGMSHKQVAVEMKKSAFFISINLFEALNTSVVESMAAGAMVFTYEGFGPRDYLKNKTNAYTFNNNEAYAMVEEVYEWMDKFDERQEEYNCIRKNARQTAETYRRKYTEEQLLQFYRSYKN
jgi:glycosyltransferase involved in cell wall biosynthesis